MKELTGSERKQLRGLAHKLEPVVRIGHEALTDNVVKAVSDALATHELIKVKFVGSKEDKDTIADSVCQRADCALAGIIGNIGIFYRENPDAEKSKKLLKKSLKKR
jgi:RNA-binding protein